MGINMTSIFAHDSLAEVCDGRRSFGDATGATAKYSDLFLMVHYLEDHPTQEVDGIAPIYKPWKGHLEGE